MPRLDCLVLEGYFQCSVDVRFPSTEKVPVDLGEIQAAAAATVKVNEQRKFFCCVLWQQQLKFVLVEVNR